MIYLFRTSQKLEKTYRPQLQHQLLFEIARNLPGKRLQVQNWHTNARGERNFFWCWIRSLKRKFQKVLKLVFQGRSSFHTLKVWILNNYSLFKLLIFLSRNLQHDQTPLELGCKHTNSDERHQRITCEWKNGSKITTWNQHPRVDSFAVGRRG